MTLSTLYDARQPLHHLNPQSPFKSKHPRAPQTPVLRPPTKGEQGLDIPTYSTLSTAPSTYGPRQAFPLDTPKRPFGKPSAPKEAGIDSVQHCAYTTTANRTYIQSFKPSRAAGSSLLSFSRISNLDDGWLHLHDTVYPPGSSLIGWASRLDVYPSLLPHDSHANQNPNARARCKLVFAHFVPSRAE